ncbi:alkaline phosphatase D family protein [Klebsiella pneumoniae]|uniref:alkaline phosphatase D family protein n=1 Tax=Klebsiella pneumoniae TaxID=573 RepID=UPI00359331DC
MSFAVCSCSNYPAGYFYVYRELAKQNVDVIIHLGDYIYEYGGRWLCDRRCNQVRP